MFYLYQMHMTLSRLLGNYQQEDKVGEALHQLVAAVTALAPVKEQARRANEGEQLGSERLMRAAATYRTSLKKSMLASKGQDQ
jgi:hypothetical protein